MSFAVTVKFCEAVSAGGVPDRVKVLELNDIQGGALATTWRISDEFAGFPSRVRSCWRSAKVTGKPFVMFMTCNTLPKFSTWLSMTNWKLATACANPITSEAISCIWNVCGNSHGEVDGGVVPEKVRLLGLKLIHDGKGVLLAHIA